MFNTVARLVLYEPMRSSTQWNGDYAWLQLRDVLDRMPQMTHFAVWVLWPSFAIHADLRRMKGPQCIIVWSQMQHPAAVADMMRDLRESESRLVWLDPDAYHVHVEKNGSHVQSVVRPLDHWVEAERIIRAAKGGN